MKGASDEKKLYWSDLEKREVAKGASPREVVFLNPDDPITDPYNTLGQFGRDMYQVMVATAVIADARQRRGLGVGVEIAAAVTMGTPVIVVSPRNSKYRADILEYRGAVVHNYIHPHVATLATIVVDDFFGAGEALAELPDRRASNNSIPSWLEHAIAEYRRNVLAEDRPMIAALRRLELL